MPHCWPMVSTANVILDDAQQARRVLMGCLASRSSTSACQSRLSVFNSMRWSGSRTRRRGHLRAAGGEVRLSGRLELPSADSISDSVGITFDNVRYERLE